MVSNSVETQCLQIEFVERIFDAIRQILNIAVYDFTGSKQK